MGLFGKLKNIFYDEEIVEVPDDKKNEEVKPRIEEVKLPKREEVSKPLVREFEELPKRESKEEYTERDVFNSIPKKSEPTFKFPIVDEEEEVVVPKRSSILDLGERIEKREEINKPIKQEYNKEYRSNNNSSNVSKSVSTTQNVSHYSSTKKVPEKTFKPSPIISPVYGVLDKNYTKEEIRERSEYVRHNPSDMNYDSVRRKAYGTLEDELENTLTKLSTPKVVENKDEGKSIEDLLSEIEGNKNISIGEIEERLKDKLEEEEEQAKFDFKKLDDAEEDFLSKFSKPSSEKTSEERINSILDSYEEKASEPNEEGEEFEKTLEHDLFNLIDSMYEEKEGE